MSLHLTPEILEECYLFLRTLQPFKNWKLPDADGLGFKVTPHVDRYGHYNDGKPQGHWPHIAMSSVHVKDSLTLLRTMAHEMCHIRQDVMGKCCADHGRIFKGLAAAIRKRHPWLEPEFND